MSQPLPTPSARTVIAWVLVIPCAVWAVVRCFGIEGGFPLVPLIAYTPYMVLLGLVTSIGAGLLRRWVPLGVGAVATLALVAVVLPRAIANGDPQIANPMEIRLMTLNSHDSKAAPDAIARLVRQKHIDVLSLQELTTQGAAELRQSAVARELPYGVLALRGDAYGSGIFSRYRLRQDHPSRAIREIEATVQLPGGSAEVFCVHPVAPTGSVAVREWKDTFAALPRAQPGGPLRILAGDFNATLDNESLRKLIDSGYRDSADAEGSGLDFTWPVHRWFPPLVTIDHVLADRRIAIGDYEVHDIPGSDHRAITVTLSLPRQRAGADRKR
jgi:endonuclease/exonuclease/phosphatase family metal-dependent hydrolase